MVLCHANRLNQSAISLTVLCPALVRSGMSETGEDPHRVAFTALDDVEHRRFTVVPFEWESAIRERGDHLASGATPEMPEPTK